MSPPEREGFGLAEEGDCWGNRGFARVYGTLACFGSIPRKKLQSLPLNVSQSADEKELTVITDCVLTVPPLTVL